MKYQIKGIMSYYENYQLKLKGVKGWVFITEEQLTDVLKGKYIVGNIVKKRTRTWLE